MSSILPHTNASTYDLRFPQRVGGIIVEPTKTNGQALDIGCAVGGSFFQLAKTFDQWIPLITATHLCYLNAQLILVSAWSHPRMKAASYSLQYIHWRQQSSQNDITSMISDPSTQDHYPTSHYSDKEAFKKNGLRRAPLMAPPLVWK